MTDEEKRKQALLLAGKLALAADRVVKANAKQLSSFILELESVLDEYDGFMIAWATGKDD